MANANAKTQKVEMDIKRQTDDMDEDTAPIPSKIKKIDILDKHTCDVNKMSEQELNTLMDCFIDEVIDQLKALKSKVYTNVESIGIMFQVFRDSLKGFECYETEINANEIEAATKHLEDINDNVETNKAYLDATDGGESMKNAVIGAAEAAVKRAEAKSKHDKENCSDYIFENYELSLQTDMEDGTKRSIQMTIFRFISFFLRKFLSSA